jgi:type IV pilus assembly protein PilN
MIKINLLAVERKAAKKKAAVALQSGQKLTIGCTLILIVAGLGIGWRYWSLQKYSAQLDTDISTAQQETTRLHSIISQVQQFEQRKAQLQQRVALIEQLRRDQTGPVHILDQISRSLPPMLWLTNLKQGAAPMEVVIDGRCTTMTGLSDFVANLEGSGYFKRGVEIIQSQTDAGPANVGELIKFSIKATFQQPGDPSKGAPGAKPPVPAAAPAPAAPPAPAATTAAATPPPAAAGAR